MGPTPAQLTASLKRVKTAVTSERIIVSQYAAERAADELQWDQWDIAEQLNDLLPDDHRHCEVGRAPSADLIWVFTPELWDGDQLWSHLIERDGVVVVRFHKA